MRLIDEDVLREKALPAGKFDPEMLVVGLGYVFSAPTADPVKHGRWETVCNEDTAYIKLYRCSCCKDDFLLDEGEIEENGEYNYCPNCGAKMDLEAEQ